MQKCRELSNLPRSTAPLRSLNFKRTTPGSIGPVLTSRGRAPQGALDPTHPAARLRQEIVWRTFPHHITPAFTLRAFPHAILHCPEVAWPAPPFSRAPPRGPGARRADVSFLKIIGKKNVHKSAVVRGRIGHKLKTALALVVTRGADVHTDGRGRQTLVFRDEDVCADKWLLQGWTYAAIPSLLVYRMPFTEIIPIMRRALITVKDRAELLSLGWRQRDGMDSRVIATTRGGDHFPEPRASVSTGLQRSSLTKVAEDRHKAPEELLAPAVEEENSTSSWFLYDDESQPTPVSLPPSAPLPLQAAETPATQAEPAADSWFADDADDADEDPSPLRTEPRAQDPRSASTPVPDPFFPSRHNTPLTATGSLGHILSRLDEMQDDEDDEDEDALFRAPPAVSPPSQASPISSMHPMQSRPSQPPPHVAAVPMRPAEPAGAESRTTARLFRVRVPVKPPDADQVARAPPGRKRK